MSMRREEPMAAAVNRWWQLAACVAAMMAIANLQYAWTLFTLPLTSELGVTLAAVQVAFTLFVIAETWLVPFEGYLVDRLGARIVVSLGGVLVGLSWLGSGLTSSLHGLWVAYALGGVGAGAVYGACIGSALKWFPDRRGLAAGLTAGAFGAATALSVVPIQWMITRSGYRATFIVWGIAQGVFVLLVAQFLARPPADTAADGPTSAPADETALQSARSYSPLEMIASLRFWVMYAMMTLVSFGGLMVTAQIKPIAHVYGMDTHVLFGAVTALSLALILDRLLNGVTRPFWGWVSDRIGRYHTMAIAFFAEALAIFALIHLIHHPLAFVVLTGFAFFAWGEIFSLFPATIADVFGPRYATTNYGVQYTAKGLSAIFAAWGAAQLAATFGSWVPILWAAVVCDSVAAVMALVLLKPLVAAGIQRDVWRQAATSAGRR
jgi:MFS transporter, OFA family, oxalate/formate antiporter